MITLLVNHLTEYLKNLEPYNNLLNGLQKEEFSLEIEGPKGGFLPFLIERIHGSLDRTSLIIVPTEMEAEGLVQDLSLFPEAKAVLFPWWQTIPYGDGHPLPSVLGERACLLSRLAAGERLMVIAPLRAFLAPLPDPDLFSARINLKIDDTLDPLLVAERLQSFGYLRVPRVSLKGEFALRGEVLDIFSFGGEEAVRIVLDFDRIAEIKQFNPFTQVSTSRRGSVTIPPVREVIFTEEVFNGLRRNLHSSGLLDRPAAEVLIERLRLNPDLQGIELLFPLCFDRSYSLIDYLPEDALLFPIDLETLQGSSRNLRKEYLALYKQALSGKKSKAENKMPLPGPEWILMDFSPLIEQYRRKIIFHTLKGGAEESPRLKFVCDPPRSFFGNISFFRDELANLIQVGYRIFIFAEYDHQADRIRHLLKDLETEVIPAGISSGFSLPQAKIMVIQENEIFGRKKRIPRSLLKSMSEAIDSFVDLNPGDYVVHINYGIGLFNGIERIKAAGNERDYIHLEYAEGERIYLPIEQVNLIQRYIGQEGRKPRLDRIGSKGWESKKNRVRRSVEDLARRLVNLYSRRKKALGFSFPADTDWQSEFEAGFPYQETEDQLRCIVEVKQDMESARPMDRLICGDVGYGKTEIALRAAFKAVMGGKQVAVLAPTTILVEQHFETFLERFAKFPVNIEMLSRFLSRKDQRMVVERIASGDCDIVIGTHRLLQKDTRFKNLGLMVVDEEQRFGVKDKEKLKELKTSVDCLTLTATPIPRTLHMSLMKIRDMSILNTPPQNRLPIETFIQEFNEDVLTAAIRNEVERGGQVYYLHNRVQTIPHVHSFLTKVLPEVSIAVAHGQMNGEELEEVMHRFIRRDFEVLLATSIIENGLDIPNVNTIVIDRADMFGISQLYQLRGRVGRADRAAFAYLFYPRGKAISELAMKRLKIISDFTELGSGFKIALKDLEIRGAGNLLGREQHGDILAVGLDMYLRLLDEAIEELGEEKEGVEAPDVYLELEYSGYIPDTYISEPMEKMEVYKKIASITTDEELDVIHRELDDRFGPIPDEVMSVFSIAEIRIICKKLYISSLKERNGTVTVEFSRLSELAVDKVLTIIRDSGGRVSLDAGKPNCLLLKTGSISLKDKSEFISERLSRLL